MVALRGARRSSSLVVGIYALGQDTRSRRSSAPPRPGCSSTRFDFPFLAARGYIDIPYLAVVIWAAVIEAQRAAPATRCSCWRCSPRRGSCDRRRGCSSGLYWLWLAAARDAGASAPGYAALAAIGPLVWAARRPRRHRPAAVLADRHRRPRRRARAQQGRRGGARGAVRVPHQARQVPGRSSAGVARPRRSRSC